MELVGVNAIRLITVDPVQVLACCLRPIVLTYHKATGPGIECNQCIVAVVELLALAVTKHQRVYSVVAACVVSVTLKAGQFFLGDGARLRDFGAFVLVGPVREAARRYLLLGKSDDLDHVADTSAKAVKGGGAVVEIAVLFAP